MGQDPTYGCHGGACPTHKGLRRERLSYINRLVKKFEEQGLSIDGIWLDYIRYPGRWSVKDPQLPDTCYCKRCLERFSKDTGILLGEGRSPKEASRWIRENSAYALETEQSSGNSFIQTLMNNIW